jgi:hypothetical protein
MKPVVLFINAAKFERSGQLVVVYRNVDQHYPATSSRQTRRDRDPRDKAGSSSTAC